ncbi:cobalamin B12-binding domain-containing protein [Nocardioides psychrotolerans]|nr:cobalamin-dependent protein [Nocardioides psychrotolerans]
MTPRHIPGLVDLGLDARLARMVLEALGLEPSAELTDLVAGGLSALEVALTSGHDELFEDFLGFQTARLSALKVSHVDTRDVAHAIGRQVAAQGASPGAVEDLVDRCLARRAGDEDTHGVGPTPLCPLARAYLGRVLAVDREQARELVASALSDGTDLGDILVDVLEAAQREVGRLWELGEISVAQEHYCTAVTQMVMADLYPYLFTGRDRRRHLVAVHAPGSLHEVGLRMVVDLLEHEGWGTTYLGAASSVEDLLANVAEQHADIVAISASMPGQVSAVRSMIGHLRADPRSAHARIIVGGRPFLVAPALGKAVGADGTASDARSTVALCERLVGAHDAAH